MAEGTIDSSVEYIALGPGPGGKHESPCLLLPVFLGSTFEVYRL